VLIYQSFPKSVLFPVYVVVKRLLRRRTTLFVCHVLPDMKSVQNATKLRIFYKSKIFIYPSWYL
jgi:hypothetical protein